MKYLSDRGWLLAVMAGCLLLSLFIFYLYGCPMDAVLYAGALSALAITVLCVIDAARLRRRRREIRDFIKSDLTDLSALPVPDGDMERAYGEAIEALNSALAENQAASARREGDTRDYYTMWAHQIKTPIAAMRLMLQSKEFSARDIEDELFRVEQYVEMALNYLRADDTADDFILKSVDVDSVIKSSLRKYSRQFIARKIALDYRETGLNVISDAKWLGFIIEQLLSNALKYTRVGGKITIEKGAGDSVTVKDDGIGIAPEDLPRVFDKGYTGYNGRTDRKSTGIGLYLCRKIARRLGHGLAIESQAGAGTAVTLIMDREELKVE